MNSGFKRAPPRTLSDPYGSGSLKTLPSQVERFIFCVESYLGPVNSITFQKGNYTHSWLDRLCRWCLLATSSKIAISHVTEQRDDAITG